MTLNDMWELHWAKRNMEPPPTTPDYWWPMAVWECRNGHQIVAAVQLGGSSRNCDLCHSPFARLRTGWVKAERTTLTG